MDNNDYLISIFEASKELNISLFKFLRLVDFTRIVSLQSLKFGINIYLPHSEVLKMKERKF
jgi:hypothetical protein